MVGINNRDLKTFDTSLDRTFKLVERIDRGKTTVVSESGIKGYHDILRLLDAGVHAALVGEALVVNPKPGRALTELAGSGPRKKTVEQSDKSYEISKS